VRIYVDTYFQDLLALEYISESSKMLEVLIPIVKNSKVKMAMWFSLASNNACI
jgi:hypothetical protein